MKPLWKVITYVRIHVHIQPNTHTHIHLHTHIHIHILTHIHIHIHVRVHVHVHVQVHVRVRVRVCLFLCYCVLFLLPLRVVVEEGEEGGDKPKQSQLIPSAVSLRIAETEQLLSGKAKVWRSRQRVVLDLFSI